MRDEKEYKDLIHRLSRIEGQVRGIREMVESDRYCVDILTQVSAIQSALNSFNKVLLSSHIKSLSLIHIWIIFSRNFTGQGSRGAAIPAGRDLDLRLYSRLRNCITDRCG